MFVLPLLTLGEEVAVQMTLKLIVVRDGAVELAVGQLSRSELRLVNRKRHSKT
jgi:hypothetical protein